MKQHIFPSAIRAARKAAGLTQQQLADKIGVPRTRMVVIESQTNGVHEGVVAQVLAALRITWSEFGAMCDVVAEEVAS